MRRESGQSQAASPQESRNPPPIHSHFRRDPVLAGCYLFSGRDLVFADHRVRAGSCLGSNQTVGIFCSQRSDKSRVGTGPKNRASPVPSFPPSAGRMEKSRLNCGIIPSGPVVLPRAPNRLENWKGPVPNYLTLRRTPNKMTQPLLKGPAEYAAL